MAEDAAQEERQRHLRHAVALGHRRLAIAPAIIESCPTRLLPNERAIEPQITAIYRRFGLNDRQIEIVARAMPEARLLLPKSRGAATGCSSWACPDVALALCAASSKDRSIAIARIVAGMARMVLRRLAPPYRGRWAAGRRPSSPTSPTPRRNCHDPLVHTSGIRARLSPRC